MEGRIDLALAVWNAAKPYVVLLILAFGLYMMWA